MFLMVQIYKMKKNNAWLIVARATTMSEMNYIKEKTEPYHISISHFLCHCVTDSFYQLIFNLFD